MPVLTLGTGTFGGATGFFKSWGSTGVEDATAVDVCLDHGLTMFWHQRGFAERNPPPV